jgi:hypothetical protein
MGGRNGKSTALLSKMVHLIGPTPISQWGVHDGSPNTSRAQIHFTRHSLAGLGAKKPAFKQQRPCPCPPNQLFGHIKLSLKTQIKTNVGGGLIGHLKKQWWLLKTVLFKNSTSF